MLLLIWFTALLIEIRRTKEALMNLYNNNYTHNCMHVCLTNNKCWLEAGARTTKPWPGVETVPARPRGHHNRLQGAGTRVQRASYTGC